jgi:Na+-driven multidrug efflux pump
VMGMPKLGLAGVAISTIISRAIGLIMLFAMFRRAFEIRIGLKDFLVFDRRLFKEILKIGWPLGVNSSCWVFSQLIVYSFLAVLGSEALAARTYLNALESYCFTLGYAVALAGQIQIAHLYGGGKTREAYKLAYRTLLIGLAVVMGNMLLLFLFGRRILGLFTDDPGILALGVSLLAINLILQPSKMLNMGMGNALSAIGDTRYMMYTSIASMSLIGVGCSYVFGVWAGWGLIGIYCCMIADELVRGLFVLLRWRGQKVLRKAEAEQLEPAGAPLPGNAARTSYST